MVICGGGGLGGHSLKMWERLDRFDDALLFASDRMQDGVGLGQVKNM